MSDTANKIDFDEAELAHLQKLQDKAQALNDITQNFIDFLSNKYKPDPAARWQLGRKGFEQVTTQPPLPQPAMQAVETVAAGRNGHTHE